VTDVVQSQSENFTGLFVELAIVAMLSESVFSQRKPGDMIGRRRTTQRRKDRQVANVTGHKTAEPLLQGGMAGLPGASSI
jgi:hypothetical protein